MRQPLETALKRAGELRVVAYRERAAEKTGFSLVRATGLDFASTSRMANGSIVVPPAAQLDTAVMRRLPPAMQFEVLEEVQLAERGKP